MFGKKVISALATGQGAVGAVEGQNCSDITMLIVFGPGTSAGAVQLEESHDINYNGTWSAIGAPVAWAAASSVKVARSVGAGMAYRARISTTIVGGTVDVYLIGR